jgi:ankyrin repeat protein
MKTDHAIRKALADLPKDLSETFARILRKSGSSNPALQIRTLQLVLAAYRPLTTDELREALSVTPGDATWDPSRLLNDVYSALACCGCVLAVDEETFTVGVIHHSVKQYISGGLDGVKHVGFSFEEAQRELADTVVTYLGYGVFGTELSRFKVHPMVAPSAPSTIVQATIGSSNTARQLAIKYLGSRRQHAVDMSKTVAEARTSFTYKPEHAFKFYNYAKTYCLYHVFYVTGHENAMFKLSSKLIYGRASELNKVDKDYWTRFHWAAEHGNRNVLLLLLQAGKIDLDAYDNDGWTPLMFAAQGGHKETVEVILSVDKAGIEAKDGAGQTPLMLAAQGGYRNIVELLLSVGKADVEAKDMTGFTPLIWAAHGGHKDTVEVLLSAGKADVESKDSHGDTSLMLAIRDGYTDIAEVLLSIGQANVESKDKDGEAPLMRAVKSGYRDMVEVLLSVGKADVEAKDDHGDTPLMRAVKNGSRDMVEVLLNVGKADFEVRNEHGETPLMLAELRRYEDIAEVLHSHIKHASRA